MKRILEAVIVEDESESLNLLQNLIKENGNVWVKGSTSDPLQAVDLILTAKPDIVFLDIRMPGKSGFDILDDLRKALPVQPYIVFTTAYDEFAIKAFEYAAFDYLLKPVEPERLNDTITRCNNGKMAGFRQETSLLLDAYKKLFFRNISGVILIDPEEVIYIEADGNYSVFHFSDNKTETVTLLMHKVEEQLRKDMFFRVSRSMIINIKYLKKINTRQRQCVLVKNGVEYRIDLSREKSKELIDRMKTL